MHCAEVPGGRQGHAESVVPHGHTGAARVVGGGLEVGDQAEVTAAIGEPGIVGNGDGVVRYGVAAAGVVHGGAGGFGGNVEQIVLSHAVDRRGALSTHGIEADARLARYGVGGVTGVVVGLVVLHGE